MVVVVVVVIIIILIIQIWEIIWFENGLRFPSLKVQSLIFKQAA